MDGNTGAAIQQLLNVYEIEVDGARRHLVCFLQPERAGARGIEAHAIVGEFTAGSDDQFDGRAFALNPAFIASFTGYMNDAARNTPDLIREATRNPGGFLFLLDPRFQGDDGQEPPPGEVIGAYTVDPSGAIVPDSFRYNDQHLLFDPASGISAMLNDQRFYEWLHAHAGD